MISDDRDTGAFYMPGARGDMVRGPKRSLRSTPVAPLDAKTLRALPATEVVDLIPMQPDRISAYLVRLPPRAAYGAPGPAVKAEADIGHGWSNVAPAAGDAL